MLSVMLPRDWPTQNITFQSMALLPFCKDLCSMAQSSMDHCSQLLQQEKAKSVPAVLHIILQPSSTQGSSRARLLRKALFTIIHKAPGCSPGPSYQGTPADRCSSAGRCSVWNLDIEWHPHATALCQAHADQTNASQQAAGVTE